MLKVFIDVPITRRKTYHIVQSETGQTVWFGRRIGPLFEYLETHGHERFLLYDGDIVYDVTSKVRFVEKD